MAPHEMRFVKDLAQRKPGHLILRPDDTAGAGDFLVVDFSNPRKMTAWATELKSKSGAFKGHQFRNADQLARRIPMLRNATIHRRSGGPEDLIEEIAG
ncbi:hypothetical protein ACFQU9_32810 [Actinomadura namibiensis]